MRLLPYPFIKKRDKNLQQNSTSEADISQSSSHKEEEKVIKIDSVEKNRLIRQGRKEALKELADNDLKNLPKTKALPEMKDRELMRVKTVFPFVFFSDCIVVEENKLTFIWSVFFFSKDIRSVLIKDIANVTVETGAFFAKIEVVDQYFAKSPLKISYLPKNQALLVRRLIQGLIVSVREDIDFHSLPKEDVIKYAMRLGEADTHS